MALPGFLDLSRSRLTGLSIHGGSDSVEAPDREDDATTWARWAAASAASYADRLPHERVRQAAGLLDPAANPDSGAGRTRDSILPGCLSIGRHGMRGDEMAERSAQLRRLMRLLASTAPGAICLHAWDGRPATLDLAEAQFRVNAIGVAIVGRFEQADSSDAVWPRGTASTRPPGWWWPGSASARRTPSPSAGPTLSRKAPLWPTWPSRSWRAPRSSATATTAEDGRPEASAAKALSRGDGRTVAAGGRRLARRRSGTGR